MNQLHLIGNKMLPTDIAFQDKCKENIKQPLRLSVEDLPGWNQMTTSHFFPIMMKLAKIMLTLLLFLCEVQQKISLQFR